MKYSELIHFEPITSVIKLVTTDTRKVQENLVKSYVFSKKMLDAIPEVISKNLDTDSALEQKGIQVVGSYGTGKSHLMAIIGAIAEDASLLDLVTEESIKPSLLRFAGKYKTLRFEVGVDKPLKDVLFFQLERFLKANGVAFTFDPENSQSWKEQLKEMIAAFEAVFPDKHILVVIDELLEYLQGRNPQSLNNDLMLLRQVGEVCDGTRFKIIFGVQELLYRSTSLQFAATMLGKVEDRFEDLIINKDDVAYVVKERLLKKDAHQKQAIRDHLVKFGHLFDGINTSLNEYVDLFPVHPSYVSTFERIKVGKSQREILKTLSARFEAIASTDVPTDRPGLVSYDTYWEDINSTASMLIIPDVRTVKDKMDTIYERIDSHFVAGRANKKAIAKQIANALAVKVLCDDLDKHNGAGARDLKEDLCQTISGIDDPELLTQTIETTANQLKSATSGQFVDQDTVSNQFYVRTEGGINIAQIVRDYADNVLKKNLPVSDQYFFEFLQFVLAIKQDPYRTGFQIWQHSLEWIDKKSYRLGYIFFGNPNERSTTEPMQQYYLFFCPLFSDLDRNDGEDEVYFDMRGFSDAFKERIYLFGAALAKHGDASSDQKPLFESQIVEHRKKALELFEQEYVDKTQLLYKGTKTNLKSYQLPPSGSSKESVFATVAAKVLNKHFSDRSPDYPAFTDLGSPITPENFEGRIKSALRKLTSFSQANREGEAILAGLGLLGPNSIDTQNSKYADSIRKQLRAKGPGKVLNRDEVLYVHYQPQNLWYTKDYSIDFQLEFVVLAAMVYKGDIEVSWAGKSLTASTIEGNLLSLQTEDLFTFQSIREPIGLPVKALKTLFSVLGLPDLSAELEKPETMSSIRSSAETKVRRVVETKAKIQAGIKCRSVDLLAPVTAKEQVEKLERLSTVLDSVIGYNTIGKLRGFKLTSEELTDTFTSLAICDATDRLLSHSTKFEKLIGYLGSAKSYVVESERPLYDDIERNIDRLASVVSSDSEAEFKRYETVLNGLIDQYADYYLQQYVKCRLSSADSQKKELLLLSDTKKICDILQDFEMLNKTEYQNWLNSLSALKPSKTDISKAAIKLEPYHDFSPREYYNKATDTIASLTDRLNTLLEKWTSAMRQIFKDPSVKDNISLLDASDRMLIESFRDGEVDISISNAVKLKKLISELSKGFDRIELSAIDLQKILLRPMTLDEARTSFEGYLEQICKGKDRSKVRILFTEAK